ncbi:putative CMP-N-acetylneuraminate-beta-galactosamide-alpha-2-3-sialyltransferase 2-like [Scophthalmus maximus]|uniref:CMP-N-acetylneuraminate-beta-galactosamide-alpha-2,3-sialyltransferase 2 n=1 Tax=Scophthalmus maximus TaxID=52904 RepID=A0A2U9BXP8_SCOMX|nr:putative CMP-N-acetylneuraminate-beta-galactosamide-alpha-2-3-sialyltransferase 2-like [Scophthalmus maximus]
MAYLPRLNTGKVGSLWLQSYQGELQVMVGVPPENEHSSPFMLTPYVCSTEQETRRGGQTFDDDIIHLHNFAGRQTQQCNLLYISVRVRRIWVLLGSLVLVFLTSLFFSVSLRGGVGFNYLEPPGWEESRRVKLVPSYAGAHSLSAPDAPQQKTCACTRCVGDPGVSDWFDENYDPDISPVWTRDNIQLPSDVYYWWVMLQPQFKPHSIQQVLLRLFQVIPGRSPYGSWDPGRCLRCAVVGNSGNLRGAGYGPTIDGHNYVMRINLAPTVGYEEDAGSHTTHHFMYPESAKNLAANVSFVLVPFKTLDLVWITSALSTGQIRFTYAPVKQFLRVDKDKVQIFNPAFFKYIHDHWTRHHGRYPSTGMLVLFFALHVCDEVNVFGFGADSRGNWHHYWEQNRYSGEFRKTGVHDADYEAQIIQQLAKAGKITVFPGK